MGQDEAVIATRLPVEKHIEFIDSIVNGAPKYDLVLED